MIDVITANKVTASIDGEYGVYVQIYSYQDAGALQDILDNEFWIPWNSRKNEVLSVHGGAEIYFGVFADIEKVQKFLDNISFDWSQSGWKELLELHEEQKSKFGPYYWKLKS